MIGPNQRNSVLFASVVLADPSPMLPGLGVQEGRPAFGGAHKGAISNILHQAVRTAGADPIPFKHLAP